MRVEGDVSEIEWIIIAPMHAFLQHFLKTSSRDFFTNDTKTHPNRIVPDVRTGEVKGCNFVRNEALSLEFLSCCCDSLLALCDIDNWFVK